MSEPLTREELSRLAEWTDTDPSVVRRNLTRRAISDLEALEKAPDLDSWQALVAVAYQIASGDGQTGAHHVHAITAEYNRMKAERDTLRAQLEVLHEETRAITQTLEETWKSEKALRGQLENSERFVKIANDTNADLRAQLEWCESERNAARARCGQLEIERGASADTIVKLMKRCEQLEAALREPCSCCLERGSDGCSDGCRCDSAAENSTTIASESPAKEPA